MVRMAGTQVLPVRRGPGDVAHALLLLQAAFGIVATLGMLLLMAGNLAYALVPALHWVVLFVLAGLVARRRRWAYVAAILVEGLSLAGYLLNLAVSVLPQVDVTVNLVGLLTEVGLPVAVMVLATRALVGES
jgi:hypothetical protein